MNVTTERAAPQAAPEIDHRARHLANAREWLRRYREALEGKAPQGAEAHAIYRAAEYEAKLANVDIVTLLLAA